MHYIQTIFSGNLLNVSYHCGVIITWLFYYLRTLEI